LVNFEKEELQIRLEVYKKPVYLKAINGLNKPKKHLNE